MASPVSRSRIGILLTSDISCSPLLQDPENKSHCYPDLWSTLPLMCCLWGRLVSFILLVCFVYFATKPESHRSASYQVPCILVYSMKMAMSDSPRSRIFMFLEPPQYSSFLIGSLKSVKMSCHLLRIMSWEDYTPHKASAWMNIACRQVQVLAQEAH